MKATTLAALLCLSASGQVDASTMAQYTAQCKMHVQHTFIFEGLCQVSVGPDGRSMVYSVTPPQVSNRQEVIEVHHFRHGEVTVDGVPGREVAIVPGWFHFTTAEGIDLRFTQPPANLQF